MPRMRANLDGLISDAASNLLGQNDPRDKEAFDILEEIIVGQAQSSAASDGSGAPSQPFQARTLVPYLKVIRFVTNNTWVIPVGVGVFAAGVFAIGYWIAGRKDA